MGGPLKLQFVDHFIIYQSVTSGDVLGLAGYTQSSGTGELNDFFVSWIFTLTKNFSTRIKING